MCDFQEEQNRLIEFLKALRGLPRWMAPESRPDKNGDVDRTEFWVIGHRWLGLEDEFRAYEGSALNFFLEANWF